VGVSVAVGNGVGVFVAVGSGVEVGVGCSAIVAVGNDVEAGVGGSVFFRLEMACRLLMIEGYPSLLMPS